MPSLNTLSLKVQKREDQRKKLLHEIRVVDKLAKEVQKKLEDDTNKQEANNQKLHDGQVSKSNEEIGILNKTLLETKAANKEIESQLRKV